MSTRAENSLAQQLEAMLTVALEPVGADELADLLEVRADEVAEVLRGLRDEYAQDHRGFTVAELASGWVMQSSSEAAESVARFADRDVSHRLSAAALETLAIIAYRQPVSRVQITALRGVNVDGVVRLLEQRGFIQEVGRADGPGQAILYGTTEVFLDRLGLATLATLPPIDSFLVPIEAAVALADELAGRDNEMAE
jgi:segregation and condensation protein B